MQEMKDEEDDITRKTVDLLILPRSMRQTVFDRITWIIYYWSPWLTENFGQGLTKVVLAWSEEWCN